MMTDEVYTHTLHYVRNVLEKIIFLDHYLLVTICSSNLIKKKMEHITATGSI